MRNADSAMYYSKRQGRRNVSFLHQRHERETQPAGYCWKSSCERTERMSRLFVTSPLIDVSSGCMTGVEARCAGTTRYWARSLLMSSYDCRTERTDRPHRTHVIEMQALKVSPAGRERYRWNLKISVNLSPRQFRDPTRCFLHPKTLAETELTATAWNWRSLKGIDQQPS